MMLISSQPDYWFLSAERDWLEPKEPRRERDEDDMPMWLERDRKEDLADEPRS